MTEQLKVFLTALMFYTRLPVARWVKHSQSRLDASIRYFPLAGCIIAGAGGLVFLAADAFLPQSVSLILSMAATVVLTGAFHEDGFADFCDGFGAGWTKEEILEIMKDSRIGTYGSVGVSLMLLFKFHGLNEMPAAFIPLGLLAGHGASRAAALLVMATHAAIQRTDGQAKPMPQNVSKKDCCIGIMLGFLPLLILPWPAMLMAVSCVLLAQWLVSRFFVRRIGGYTGDCLGATQQLCEAACYLGIMLSWTFI